MASRNEGLFQPEKGFNTDSTSPMVDITANQGYHGHLPDIGAYITNGAYVRRNLCAVVLATPKGFDLLDDPEIWHRAFKAIIESQSKISGIVSTLNLEYVDTAIPGGEVQKSISNVTRTPSTPTHEVVEKPGKPISKFWNGWILNLLGDPLTQIPRVLTYPDNAGNKDIDLLPDMVGATVLYFEPDHTFQHVIEAWLCTDMKPANGVAVEGARDKEAGGTNLVHSLEFTSIQTVGAEVNALAQAELDKMNLGGLNPDLMPPIVKGRTATVNNAPVGLAEGIKEAKAKIAGN